MHFGNQTALYGLFGLPFAVFFFVWVFRRKKSLLSRMGAWELVQRLIESTSSTKQIVKAVLLVLGIGLLIFSLSRPQYGSIERPIARKGVDIFIAIDTSLSMMAEDIAPNRLARAREQLKGLIHRLKGDRVGIITFAGTAFIQCPLTLDYGLAQNILDTINIDSVPVQGTAIGEAIRTATRSFERSAKGEKVLVLLTDGEDHETNPEGAAKEAAKEGVRIYSIGIGSEKGEPIRLADGSYKRDKEGHTVNSRLDLVLLQKIAQLTNGKTIKANPTGGLELDAIYEDIGLLQKQTLRSQTYTIYEERFQYFLLPVILILILEMLASDRKRTGAPRLAFLLISLPFLFGFRLSDPLAKLNEQGNKAFQNKEYDKALEFYKNAQVESPESPEIHFNIGNVLLKEQKYDDAIQEFEKAAALFKEQDRIANANYNIGVAHYRTAEQLASMENYQEAIKKLEEAMAANQTAMRKNPGDEDPKFNYEQSKRLWKELLEKLKEQQQQQQQQQQQNQEQNQDQQQQQNGESEKSKEEQKKQEQQKSETGENQEKKEEEQKEQQKQEEKPAEKKEEKTAKAEEKKEDEKSPENSEQKQQEAKIGEMSREDALRLLSTLPEENKEALKEALKLQYSRRPGTDKDW
jgi:Ca-activated chloride channel family protein